MESFLLFLVLLLISGGVWFIDRLGRAAQAREQGPPPLPPSARMPRPRRSEAPLGTATPEVMVAAASARVSMPVSGAMRERVRRHDVPRPIDRIRRQASRARHISVARARDGIAISTILGPCRGLEPFD